MVTNQTENYHPTSQISSIGKSFERIIKYDLVHYIEDFKLLSNTQYGFRTTTNLQ